MSAVPAAIPVTNPVEVTEATSVLPLTQLPPDAELEREVELPRHTVNVPVIVGVEHDTLKATYV